MTGKEVDRSDLHYYCSLNDGHRLFHRDSSCYLNLADGHLNSDDCLLDHHDHVNYTVDGMVTMNAVVDGGGDAVDYDPMLSYYDEQDLNHYS